MNNDSPLPEVDRRLDSLLAAWAEGRRLTDRQSAAIRDSVIEPLGGLGLDWWRRFTTQYAAILVRSQTYPAGLPISSLSQETATCRLYVRLG